MSMFCYQCEQTAKGKGCDYLGVCGKTSEAATLQDLLIHAVKGIGIYAYMVREIGVKDKDTDLFVIEGLFTTVTNVDFDPSRLEEILRRDLASHDALFNATPGKGGDQLRELADPEPDDFVHKRGKCRIRLALEGDRDEPLDAAAARLFGED